MSDPPPPPKPRDLSSADVTIQSVRMDDGTAARVSPWSFLFAVDKNPCFRSALMWGMGVGGVMAAHSAIRHRNQWKAINAAVGTFLVVSSGKWIFCRQAQREEQERMKGFMSKIAAKQEARAQERKGGPGANQLAAGAAAAADTKPADKQ